MGLDVSLASEPPGGYHRTPQRALLYRGKPWKALCSMLILSCHLIFSHGMTMKTVFLALISTSPRRYRMVIKHKSHSLTMDMSHW